MPIFRLLLDFLDHSTTTDSNLPICTPKYRCTLVLGYKHFPSRRLKTRHHITSRRVHEVHWGFLNRFVVLRRCDKVTCALFSSFGTTDICFAWGWGLWEGIWFCLVLIHFIWFKETHPVTGRHMFVWVTKTTSEGLNLLLSRCTLDQIMVGKSKQ